jgi:group I intron endonuclease
MESGIYSITNMVNGKRYIGSTENMVRRWKEHRYRLCKGNHHTAHLQAAWNKYGAVAFVFEVLEYIEDIADLLTVEQYYADWLETTDKRYGYNTRIDVGGSHGFRHSEETLRKLSESRMGEKNPMYGTHPSEETLAKRSAALKGRKNPHEGRPMPPEARAKLSEMRKGENNPMFGVPAWNKGKAWPDAIRAKVSETKKRKAEEKSKARIPLPGAKLTWDDVDEIRRLWKMGTTRQTKLASTYGVSLSCIQGILYGKTWKKHVM